MSGRKVFTAGEVLQAADVNDFLMDQSVMVFAGTAARGSAIPSPTEGMVTYLQDADELQVYTTDWGGVGRGKILQIVSNTKIDTFSTTSSSFTDVTGLSATITPSFTTSKILVLVKTLVGMSTTVTTNGVALQLLRDATAIGNTADGHIYQQPVDATRTLYGAAFDVLDSPASTSAISYKVQIKTSSGTAYVNRSDTETESSASSITLMEVAD